MKLIIDMPDHIYNILKDDKSLITNVDHLAIVFKELVKKGTPLPKGHGRLFIFDEEKAKKYFTKFSFSSQDWISDVGISNATWKVIEADKENDANENS